MTKKYDFDEAFQKKLVAMMLRDSKFATSTDGLINPEFFELEPLGYIADIANRHRTKYRETPSAPIVLNYVREDKAKRSIDPDFLAEVKDALRWVYTKADLTNRDYMVDASARFARERAVEEALLKGADILDAGGEIEDIAALMQRASQVGAIEDGGSLDVFAGVEDRIKLRTEKMTSSTLKTGITTGYKEIDDVLYHGGWGRKELAAYMGGAKSGKSFSLMDHATAAARDGHNVLFLTLENSKDITADRIDANVSGIKMKDLASNPSKIRSAYKALEADGGKFKVHEYPSGTLTNSMIRRLLEKYKSEAIIFDLLVVDYAGIMASERHYDNERFASKEIWVGLRALLQEENIAGLTAAQTNREGGKATTAGKYDVAEDVNITRTIDVMITINATDDEKARNEMRLWFAASRNQEDGFGFHCKTDKARAKSIVKILGRV